MRGDIDKQPSYNHGNYLKYLDRFVCENRADPDQTAPKEQSEQGLHCLPIQSASCGGICAR